jgi:hypothetical protein
LTIGVNILSIFSAIKDAIFGGPASASPPVGTKTDGTSGSPKPAPPSQSPQAASATSVDVSAVLDNLRKGTKEDLNWRVSIVDLMKLLKLDSSLKSRKELARELNYTGDTNDSATMNMWLHKQVMHKLAENGGKVPDELRDGPRT